MGENARVVILGAGISGLGLGWRLAARGLSVDILESRGVVGGLAGTVRDDGCALDFGPHTFFSDDPEIRETVLGLFDPPLAPRPRRAKFLYQGRLLEYPLTAAGVLGQMGWQAGCRAAASCLWGRMAAGPRRPQAPAVEDQSVEEWARAHFGEYLYRSFFQPYTEQFWLMPASALSARAIPSHTRMSFLRTLSWLLRRRHRGAPSLLDREALPTYYPETGYGEIADRVARRAREAGGSIHLNCRAVAIERAPGPGPTVLAECRGRPSRWEAATVVSTIPLPALIGMLRPLPPPEVHQAAEQLDYRPLLVLGLVTTRQSLLKADYVYQLDRPYNRLAEMNRFSPRTSPPGDNVLAVEIPCRRGDATWTAAKEALFERCIGWLERDGLLARRDVTRLLLVKAPDAYPIYRKGYAAALARCVAYVGQCPGLVLLGRTGEFRYLDADQCLRRAFDLAERLWASQPLCAVA